MKLEFFFHCFSCILCVLTLTLKLNYCQIKPSLYSHRKKKARMIQDDVKYHFLLSFLISLFNCRPTKSLPCRKTVSVLYTRIIKKSFQTFFVWALLLIVHTWNTSSLRSNLLRLQCTCSTVPTTSGGSHGSPLVWACQWPSSQPLSSPQLSNNDSLWA